MNTFSVNLSTIFTETPFLDRFKKSKEYGFDYVECQLPYSYSIEQIREQLTKYSLKLDLINLPAGDWDGGDRGIAIDSSRVHEFKESVEKGIEYATALNVNKIHCMAGILSQGIEVHSAREVYLNNLHYAGQRLATHGIDLLIEPINTINIPNYFLHNIHEANAIIQEINLANIQIQFDFYHIQRIHGNLLSIFQQYFDVIGHVQIADSPDRHEPGTGEIHFQNVFKFIKQLNYKGRIGLEYTPKGKSEESFEWLSKGGDQI